MATFGSLKDTVLSRAGVTDHFDFRDLSPVHAVFWDKMNAIEFERGYKDEYTNPGTPALCEMDLLTDEEFAEWLAQFDRLTASSRVDL